jgi:pyruvate ferredoxin oxidoreductase gamma subunit
MFRIRFHGRGGQGMKTASRILGTALFLEGFEVQDAPRYGAERRGAPIFAYVRADRQPILERGVIRHPDLVIVADDSLIPVPAAGVLQGITDQTLILIYSHDTADTWQQRLNLRNRILVLPASELATDQGELRYVGAACAGAAASLLGVVSEAKLAQAIRQEIGPLGDTIVTRNLETASRGFQGMHEQRGRVREGEPVSAKHYQAPDWLELPFEDARVSAPIIHAPATSTEVRTGLWRTMRPVIDYQRCKGCWWVCSSFCPDGAIHVTDAGRPEIDYDHCKGCMVCVAQCPPHAIETIAEKTAQAAEAEESS